jgi:hypothetical protein
MMSARLSQIHHCCKAWGKAISKRMELVLVIELAVATRGTRKWLAGRLNEHPLRGLSQALFLLARFAVESVQYGRFQVSRRFAAVGGPEVPW